VGLQGDRVDGSGDAGSEGADAAAAASYEAATAPHGRELTLSQGELRRRLRRAAAAERHGHPEPKHNRIPTHQLPDATARNAAGSAGACVAPSACTAAERARTHACGCGPQACVCIRAVCECMWVAVQITCA
jgi:hypothetical protein